MNSTTNMMTSLKLNVLKSLIKSNLFGYDYCILYSHLYDVDIVQDTKKSIIVTQSRAIYNF